MLSWSMAGVALECPHSPVLAADGCVVSNNRAHISIQYSETVRVRCVHLYYKEAVYNCLSEKDWDCVDTVDISHGSAFVTLTSLRRAAMYKVYATASNDVGSSLPSDELWFRTIDCEDVDVHVVRK